MSPQKRPSRAPEAKRMYVTAKTSEDFPETTPVVWIQQTKEGISYGVRAYGRSLKRNTAAAQAEFTRMKHFAEVEMAVLAEEYQKELLRLSAVKADTERSDAS